MRMVHIILLASILIIAISGFVSSQPLVGCQTGGTVNTVAPWYCSYLNPQIQQVWVNWLPILFIAISVSFSIATVIFLIGTVFHNDRLRTFGTGELYEAFATTIIVGLFMFLAAVMFGLLPAMTAGPIDPYDAALSYIATTINTTTVTASSLFNIESLTSFYTSINFQFTAADGEVRTPPIVGILSFALTYFFFFPSWSLIVFLTDALFSLYTQFYLIIFMMYASIPVFLIPGVLFRSFIPTRHLGGMMIAIAIGFYFIMPTLFSVAYFYTSNNIASQLALANGVVAKYGQNSNFVQAASSPQSPLALAVSSAQSSFSGYWLSILFFPALIVALTYSMVTQIAELLGGMSRSSGKLRALV